jgi:hypothetical protein
MSDIKYKKYYELMWQNNTELLNDFKKIHDQFFEDPEKWQDEFNSAGRDILDVMRDWERRLCSGMERGKFAGYSDKLAEKFWQQIRQDFPLIDRVGVKKASTRTPTAN